MGVEGATSPVGITIPDVYTRKHLKTLSTIIWKYMYALNEKESFQHREVSFPTPFGLPPEKLQNPGNRVVSCSQKR